MLRSAEVITMTLIEAKIILKKREACAEECSRSKCLNDNTKRCSICPYHTKLDDYITARRIVDNGKLYN